MRAIGFGILFAFIGLIGSYAVFGTVRGHYINPEVLIGSITGQHSSFNRAIGGKILGAQDRAFKIIVGTVIGGVIGILIGAATGGGGSTSQQRTIATRPREAPDCSYCNWSRRAGRKICEDCGKQLVEDSPSTDVFKRIEQLTEQVAKLESIKDSESNTVTVSEKDSESNTVTVSDHSKNEEEDLKKPSKTQRTAFRKELELAIRAHAQALADRTEGKVSDRYVARQWRLVEELLRKV